MIEEVIYVADPMCSWCWGFAPELQRLRSALDVKFTLLVGGLRSSGDTLWDDGFKAFLRQHWEEVSRATGQPFNTQVLEREAFDYDTHKACKGVVVMQRLAPESVFDYFHDLQEAFYVKNIDITQSDTLAQMAQKYGVQRELFLEFYAQTETQKELEKAFYKAKTMGASAFPSLIVLGSEGHFNLIRGYRKAEDLIRMLR